MSLLDDVHAVPGTTMRWQSAAACARAGADSRLFFAADGETPAEQRIREARAALVCAQCPVTAACLAFADAEGVVSGVWGGLTEEQLVRRARVATRLRRLL